MSASRPETSRPEASAGERVKRLRGAHFVMSGTILRNLPEGPVRRASLRCLAAALETAVQGVPADPPGIDGRGVRVRVTCRLTSEQPVLPEC